MKRLMIVATMAVFMSSAAYAQIGDILKHKDKIVKGAKVAQAGAKEFTWEEEYQIGRVVAARVLATYPLSKDKKVNDYVKLIGMTLVPYSSRPDASTWHFGVLDTDVVNAFACPGNFVFVTAGALKSMKSEAELAVLLAHEISHATQKHILGEIKKANMMTAGVDLASSSAGGGWTAELGQRVGNIAVEKLFTKGMSRRDELEADRMGVEIAAAAGYRTESFLAFLETSKSIDTKKSKAGQLTSTHPPAADRIAALKPKVSTDGAVLDTRFKQWVVLR